MKFKRKYTKLKLYELARHKARLVVHHGGDVSLSLVDYHIAVMKIVAVATAHRCTGLNKRLKGNSTGCLLKLDFFAINHVT